MAGSKDSSKPNNAVSKYLKDLMEKFIKLPVSVCKSLWKLGREDPRRVVHALKVGLALTLASLLYLLEPLYEGFGQNAMWAVMTVVVVLEYTAGELGLDLADCFNVPSSYLISYLNVYNGLLNYTLIYILIDLLVYLFILQISGATLCKGLNRGFGTLCAGLLAFFVEEVTEESGKVFRACFIGASVFVVGKYFCPYYNFVCIDVFALNINLRGVLVLRILAFNW